MNTIKKATRSDKNQGPVAFLIYIVCFLAS